MPERNNLARPKATRGEGLVPRSGQTDNQRLSRATPKKIRQPAPSLHPLACRRLPGLAIGTKMMLRGPESALIRQPHLPFVIPAKAGIQRGGEVVVALRLVPSLGIGYFARIACPIPLRRTILIPLFGLPKAIGNSGEEPACMSWS